MRTPRFSGVFSFLFRSEDRCTIQLSYGCGTCTLGRPPVAFKSLQPAGRGFPPHRPIPYHARMPTDLTPQQRAAVTHRGSSVVLASGAGCGKTHVLTARYLSHLTEDGADPGEVVAITFTDRAAREMRDRIR